MQIVSVTRVENIVTVTCAGFHLTSFAVLVDVGGAHVSTLVRHKDLILVSLLHVISLSHFIWHGVLKAYLSRMHAMSLCYTVFSLFMTFIVLILSSIHGQLFYYS